MKVGKRCLLENEEFPWIIFSNLFVLSNSNALAKANFYKLPRWGGKPTILDLTHIIEQQRIRLLDHSQAIY